MPSPAAVLVVLFTALAGYCSLQRAELQAVREQNRMLTERTERLEYLEVEVKALRKVDFALMRRDFGGE